MKKIIKLSKHAILANRDTRLLEVEVPEWGGTLFARTLSVADAVEFEEKKSSIPEGKIIALYLCYTLADEAGVPLFLTDEVDELCKKDADVMLRLFHLCLNHNKMGESNEKERTASF